MEAKETRGARFQNTKRKKELDGPGCESKWFSQVSILAPSGLDEVVGLRWVCPEFCFGVAVRSEQVPIGGKRVDVVQVQAPQGRWWEGRSRDKRHREIRKSG